MRKSLTSLLGLGNIFLYSIIKFIASRKCLTCSNVNYSSNKLCFECFGKLEFVSNNSSDNIAVVKYNKISEQIIHSLKYSDNHEYAVIMADYISHFLRSHKISYDYIIPVPISRKKLFKQKFNHSLLIAKSISSKKTLGNTLLKTLHTPSQTLLNADQRRKNIKNTFALKHKFVKNLKNKTILLLDDVTTTGSTLDECRLALEGAKSNKIISVTFAKTYI